MIWINIFDYLFIPMIVSVLFFLSSLVGINLLLLCLWPYKFLLYCYRLQTA